MTLSEFLKLSMVELELEKEMVSLISARDLERLKQKIKAIDLHSLIRICIKNKAINVICQHTVFDEYWNAIWKKCGPTNHDTNVPIEYFPINTVCTFDLIKGFYVYEQYRKLVNENETSAAILIAAKEYLEFSAELGCFFALNALCYHGLRILHEATDSHEVEALFTKILAYASHAATLHWTPGYFLLGNVCDAIMDCATNMVDEYGSLNKKLLLSDALRALTIAQKLEPYSSSMQHNAYQGKSIQEASGGKFVDWFQFKRYIETKAKIKIDATERERIYQEASSTVDGILSQYSLNIAASVPNELQVDDTPMVKRSL